MKKENSGKNSTKKLTVCALLSAVGVVLMYLGSLVDILDISMAVLASYVCIIAVIEYGGIAPWLIYGTVSVLSLLLLGNKNPAIYFVLFFGFYPILKEKIEKLNKVVSWILKETVFIVSVCVIAVAGVFVTSMGNEELIQKALQQPIFIAVVFVLSEIVFVLYDWALTRVITFYLIKLRYRLKIK